MNSLKHRKISVHRRLSSLGSGWSIHGYVEANHRLLSSYTIGDRIEHINFQAHRTSQLSLSLLPLEIQNPPLPVHPRAPPSNIKHDRIFKHHKQTSANQTAAPFLL
jgi:hypothetical protein